MQKHDVLHNSWLKDDLFKSLKAIGIIDNDEIPLGETKGSDRKNKNTEDE